jgi:hypothetical protein
LCTAGGAELQNRDRKVQILSFEGR